jgi:hypothetical protein
LTSIGIIPPAPNSQTTFQVHDTNPFVFCYNATTTSAALPARVSQSTWSKS